jgi:hypothetical protein
MEVATGAGVGEGAAAVAQAGRVRASKAMAVTGDNRGHGRVLIACFPFVSEAWGKPDAIIHPKNTPRHIDFGRCEHHRLSHSSAQYAYCEVITAVQDGRREALRAESRQMNTELDIHGRYEPDVVLGPGGHLKGLGADKRPDSGGEIVNPLGERQNGKELG